MSLTVADVLQMSAVRSADPELLAGAESLGRSVRWVHTTELADIADLLREGDLVLTTGIALPDADEGLDAFATSLAESGAAGLFIELGRRWAAVPTALSSSCATLGLPLVALRREVRFAGVAQTVGERIVDEQLTELRESQQVHDTFTALSVAEAGPKEILAAVSTLAAAAVVLESDDRRVLDYNVGAGNASAFLDDWRRRSMAVTQLGRTAWDRGHGWLVTPVGRPERRWGRLIVDCPSPPSQRLVAVVERGSAALAMHMLHDHQRGSRDRQLHHELLVALLANPTSPEIEQRCRLAGLKTTNRDFISLAIRELPDRDRRTGRPDDELLSAIVHAAATTQTNALVAVIGGSVKVLISVPRRQSAAKAAHELVDAVGDRVSFVAAASSVVNDLSASDRAMREAQQVLSALKSVAQPGIVHHLRDVHLRGLLTLLAEDERVIAFSERELHQLHLADQDGEARLIETLGAVLDQPGNKSAVAASLAMSRPVLYERIARIERILGVDLDDGETRTSLHVALIAAEMQSTRRGTDPFILDGSDTDT